jgi:hypothetical protein
VAEQEGLEPARGVLKITDGIFPRTGEVTHGFLCDLGDRDRREVTRAGPSGQVHRGPAVGCDAIAGFVGNQRRGHHPAGIAFVGQLAGEPGAPGASRRDEDQMSGLRLHLADELIDGTLAGAQSSEGHHLGAVILSPVGSRDGVFVDFHANEECARLRQRCPPQVEG